MTIADALKAAKAFNAALNGEAVSAEEIQRRTGICHGSNLPGNKPCPMKRRASGFSQKLSRLLGALANSGRAPRSLTDQSCGVCGCSLMLLVPAQDKDQHVDTPAQARKRPVTCWMNDKISGS